MPDNCTIYCKVLNLEEISRLLHSHFPTFHPTAADSMTVHGRTGSLRLTQRMFREPGDEFCRLMLGLRAFVKRIEHSDSTVQQALVDHLDLCDLAIGVVAEPAFEADERYDAVVFAIAKALDGVIFNGHEMLDADGTILLVTA